MPVHQVMQVEQEKGFTSRTVWPSQRESQPSQVSVQPDTSTIHTTTRARRRRSVQGFIVQMRSNDFCGLGWCQFGAEDFKMVFQEKTINALRVIVISP